MSTDQPVNASQPTAVTQSSSGQSSINSEVSHAAQEKSTADDTNSSVQDHPLTTSALNDNMSSRVSPQLDASAAASGPIRVPGTYPPKWVPDQEANSCTSCGSLFTLIKRRHHCRSCGKIFCGDCCNLKAKLLYMDNKEARVCVNCFEIIDFTLTRPNIVPSQDSSTLARQPISVSSSQHQASASNPGTSQSSEITRPILSKIHGVLKTSNTGSRLTNVNDSCNTSSASSDQQSNKQVIFADGVRPGTDLSEPNPVAATSSSSSSESQIGTFQSLLTRQHRRPDTCVIKKTKDCKTSRNATKNITLCDELGYLPPVVISKDAPIMNPSSGTFDESGGFRTTNALTNLILNQFKLSKKTIQASMESRSCPLNEIVKFEDISDLVGINGVVTFLLLRDFELKVKIVKKDCCMNETDRTLDDLPQSRLPQPLLIPPVEEEALDSIDDTRCMSLHDEIQSQLDAGSPSPDKNNSLSYWCFLSNGLEKLGQDEVLLVIDKDLDDCCIPRDVFKIYLTLHELALRRQTLEHLGNLLFQDGLFGNRDTAGLLLVRPSTSSCLKNLIIPNNKNYLVALVLQRWEVPWSKVFPMRLLLRLGHKYNVYPYPIVSFKRRDPVYYEVGHTIISILGDFRNFRYSLTYVEGLKVSINKATKKVLIRLTHSSYHQFNKVLDSANNEHVLAWSSCPFAEADGHLVCVQNEDGQYETVEFYDKMRAKSKSICFRSLDEGSDLGASFIVFSGALKVNQTGQPAKISIVEDGLLIQIQSCTMAALKNSIHFMHHFDIDSENSQDVLNRVEISWQKD